MYQKNKISDNKFIYIIIFMLIFSGSCNTSINDKDRIIDERMTFQIDSVRIDNIVELAASGPSIYIFSSIKNDDSCTYNLWFNKQETRWSDPSYNPYIWGEIENTIYRIRGPLLSSVTDTSLQIGPNEKAILTLLLSEPIFSLSIAEMKKEYFSLLNEDFVIKMINIENGDTLIFSKTPAFKITYSLDYKEIQGNDSVRMNKKRIPYTFENDFDS